MIKLIKKILGICNHNWETKTSIEMYNTGWGKTGYSHTEKHCQCTKCGAWKKFEV